MKTNNEQAMQCTRGHWPKRPIGLRIRRALVALAATTSFTACGDVAGPVPAGLESVAGEYDLVGVNGAPLPFVQGGFSLTSAVLSLGGDGSAALTFEINDPSPRSVDVFTGAHSVSGSRITLNGVDIDGDPLTLTGTISGNVVTLISAGNDLEFRRRT